MAEALENTTTTHRIFPASKPVRSAENKAQPGSQQTRGKEQSMRTVLIQYESVVRLDIRELLSRIQRMDAVGRYPHCKQVRKLIKQLRPDIVVLDTRTPSRRSLGALQSTRRLNSRGGSILLFERFSCVDVRGAAEDGYGFAYRFAYYQPARIGPAVRPIFVLQPELYGVLSANGH